MTMPIPPAIMHQTQEAAAIQDYQEIVDIFARAVRAMPGHFNLRVFYAGALGQCGYVVEARRIFKDLQRGLPSSRQTEFRGLVGTIWRNAGRNDLAEPQLRAMVGDPACSLAGYEAFVDVLEHLNKLEEAEAALRSAARKFPDSTTLVFLEGRLCRRRGDFAKAEATLRRCLAMPGIAPSLAVEAFYELGHALEGQGRYRDAFAAFQEGKRGPLAEAGQERQMWRSRLEYMKEHEARLPEEKDFRRWSTPLEGPSDPAFLIGCPRSGTTLLERVLDAHPQLATAPEVMVWRSQVWLPLLKELRAKGLVPDGVREVDALDAITGEQLRVAREKYRRGMEGALELTIGRRLLVDKNPSYFPLIPALTRMFPGTKLLVALRDPRAVVWSCFTQTLPLNPETAAFLDLGTTAEHVARWLGSWLVLRPRLAVPWREVRYEKMVTDFSGEARKTMDFLGVPWDDRVSTFHASGKPVRSPSYASASRPLYTSALDKWRHYEEFLEPHLAPLKPVMAELGYAW